MRILHIITRMIIGGAQENTLFNCLDLIKEYQDDCLLVTGPTEGPEGKLLSQGRAGGLPVEVLRNLQRAIHPIRDIQAYYQLQTLIRNFRPDVVHTHSAKGGFLGRAAAWYAGVPVVIHSVHGAPFHPYQSGLARRLFILLERWAAKRCHHLISVADAMTELMVEAGVAPREKFTTIYSGMDVEPFRGCEQFRPEARQKLGYQQQHIVFGKIARLFNLKGHEYLIEAAREVISDNPNCRFLLVGDGVLRESLEARIRQFELQPYFQFTGLVTPERIPYYLSAMDALVHTSLREGLARTLPQALIAGKPVVSYDIDGAREVVIPGQTGYLLPAKSTRELAVALLELAASGELRNRLGQGGAMRFTDQFRHQFMTGRIRDKYVQLLEQKAGRKP
ncbi:MAG: glycosyltransferase family 4 protein [Planctomycetales bacterium]|nr:glycosyltransferase family 4 protein [Planctomycetales bacterium]